MQGLHRLRNGDEFDLSAESRSAAPGRSRKGLSKGVFDEGRCWILKRDFGSASPKSSTAPDLSLLMPFILGKKKTNELLFTGDKINAEEALSLGLINKIVPREDLESAARELAMRIAPTPLPIRGKIYVGQ